MVKDVALPYMLDGRHPADMVFLVCEADHRFYQRDEIPVEEWLEAAAAHESYGTEALHYSLEEIRRLYPEQDEDVEGLGPEDPPTRMERGVASSSTSEMPPPSLRPASDPQPSLPPATGEASTSSPSGTGGGTAEPSAGYRRFPAQAGMQSAGQRRAFGAWTAGARPKQFHADALATPELASIIHICNQAAREGCGDCIWMTWCGSTSKGGRKSVPAHGSMLVAMTQRGARDFLSVLRATLPMHADVILRNACLEGRINGASYVYPALGSFATHQSGIEAMVRDSEWTKSWCQEGVAPSRGQNPRWLARYTRRGEPGWVCKLRFGTTAASSGRRAGLQTTRG